MIDKKRDTSKKRTAIMDAAQKVFIESGYDNAGMDLIAETANASKRTVYNHFASKEELFQAVLHRLISAGMKLKQIPYAPDVPLASQLMKFIDAKIAFTQNKEWMGLLRVTAGVFARRPELAKETLQRTEDADTLAQWLKDAAEDGRMHITNPKLASAVFWSMVGGAFFWPTIFKGPLPNAEAIMLKEEMIAMFLERYGS